MIRLNEKLVKSDYFPDGTLLIKYLVEEEEVNLYWQYENNEELLVVYFLTRKLQEQGITNIQLWMPYIPNARQDRVKRQEDVFTLKYFCEMINNLNFKKVYVLDSHSDVTNALLNHIVQIPVKPYIEQAIRLSQLDKEKIY